MTIEHHDDILILTKNRIFWTTLYYVLSDERETRVQSVEGGYDQSKNWKVGRSDLSKTERSEPPTSQFPRGRPLLAPYSKTISQNHIIWCVQGQYFGLFTH